MRFSAELDCRCCRTCVRQAVCVVLVGLAGSDPTVTSSEYAYFWSPLLQQQRQRRQRSRPRADSSVAAATAATAAAAAAGRWTTKQYASRHGHSPQACAVLAYDARVPVFPVNSPPPPRTSSASRMLPARQRLNYVSRFTASAHMSCCKLPIIDSCAAGCVPHARSNPPQCRSAHAATVACLLSASAGLP